MARIFFRHAAKRLRHVENAGWWLEAQALGLFWWWMKRVGPERASRMGYRLVASIGPCLDKQRHLLGNLGIAFPSLGAAEREALARRIWGNLGAVLAEYPHLNEICSPGPNAYTEVEIDQNTRAIVEGAHPAVYVSPHLANWEIVAAVGSRIGIPVSIVYNPQSNPRLDRMLQDARHTEGVGFVPQSNALRTLIKQLRQGRSVGLLPDQRSDTGEMIPYFGIGAPTVTSPAQLAMKMECPIVPVEVERLGPARFRVVFHAPLGMHPAIPDIKERASAITRDLNEMFEQWIRKQPEAWHCMKRRWPRSAYSTQGTTASESTHLAKAP